MSSVSRAVAAGILVLCVTSCVSTRKPVTLPEILATPAHRLSSYVTDFAAPLADRVAMAPDFLLTYLREADKVDTYQGYLPTAAERDQIRATIDLLPAAYKATLKERLIGIYFISGWTGSGMADFALDEKGTVYCLLVVNPDTMRHTLSDWLTRRESTCFVADSPGNKTFTLAVDCGTAYSGLTYILLHEGSHIMDYVHGYSPFVKPSLRDIGIAGKGGPFTADAWESFSTPRAPLRFPAAITFYGLSGGPRLHLSQAPAVYKDLESSPFVSLYGTMSWLEDFAEYCTWHYLTAVLGQPYRIVLRAGDTVVFDDEPMKRAKVVARLKDLPQGLLDP
jgi:hypothetical protein